MDKTIKEIYCWCLGERMHTLAEYVEAFKHIGMSMHVPLNIDFMERYLIKK